MSPATEAPPTGQRQPEYRAIHRHARITARKARLIADLIRGRSVNQALETLEFEAQSPAQGAGTDCPELDQLDQPRPADGCDLGAVEEQAQVVERAAGPGMVETVWKHVLDADLTEPIWSTSHGRKCISSVARFAAKSCVSTSSRTPPVPCARSQPVSGMGRLASALMVRGR